MSATTVIERWVNEVRKDAPKFLRPSASNIVVSRHEAGAKRVRLYSYGYHFELARWVDATDVHDGYWMLNGDTYSVTTSRHQSDVRGFCQRTGAPVVILPHTAMQRARIDLDSIVPTDITRDRMVPELRRYTRAQLPAWLTHYIDEPSDHVQLTNNGDGSFTYHAQRHVLGESAFHATYTTHDADGWHDTPAYFLSAFDHQETRSHYFLCQLPAGAEPATVADAFESLKPADVVDAESAGLTVTRQGDVFAVPVQLTTREVRRSAVTLERMGNLLGLSHIATEVAVTPVGTFARGTLRHRPDGWNRTPEHRNQRMGDGKAWHRIVKNTVPVDRNGDNRAWSIVGNVD